MKRMISLLCTLTVCLTLFASALPPIPVSADTSGDFQYTVTDGKAAITGYTGSATELTIPSTLGGYPVTSIGNSAFYGCESLTSIALPDSVTSIEGFAFYDCTSLTSITIPDSVISIGDCVFCKCNSLTSITIPDSVTSIGDCVFESCKSLSSLRVADGNTVYYSSGNCIIETATRTVIAGCNNSTIPDGVACIGDFAFRSCTLLTSIRIPDSVTSINQHAFAQCMSLESITIPHGVTSIDFNAFWYCTSLTSVTIPDSVTDIAGSVFTSCISLKSITIPGSVTSISFYTFEDCTSLTSIAIPDSVTSIEAGAFEGCSRLTDVYYAGSEAQWKAINIGSSNSALTKATIHYNSTSSVTPELRYGADRFTFGEDIAGFVGDTLDTLAVYTSGNYDTTALTVTSSDPTVVAIDNITHGVGQYITQEHEHAATIPLIFKAAGTAIVTVTSPEGLRTSVNVTTTVEDKGIAVFSTEKSLSVETGESLWLGFGLLDSEGLIEEDWKQMAITVSDPTVIALSEYKETEFGYTLEAKGLKPGVTNLVVTDGDSGAHTILQLQVFDKYAKTYSYDIQNMKTFYPNNRFDKHLQTNIYNVNGLYVNNYSCTKNGSEYTVSFDAYNACYYAGAVDIYDANGLWMGYEELQKYSDITSLWETADQAWFLITNAAAWVPGGNDAHFVAYDSQLLTQHTAVKFTVPEGGYFTISNNVSTSPGTFIINSLEILFDGAYAVLDLITSDTVKATTLQGFKDSAKRSLADCLIEARNESLKSEVKKKAYKVAMGTMQSEIKSVTTKFTKEQIADNLELTEDMRSEMATLAENILKSYNIEWKHLFKTAAGVVESGFVQFAGPAGIALKGCFAITKGTNKFQMAVQMACSFDKPYVTVYSAVPEGEITSRGVIINTNGYVDAEAVLQVFRVSNSDSLDVVLDADNPLERHQMYNICFVKDDQEVQPNGKVKVHVPIPQGMKSETAVIYRQEADGSWTALDAHAEGNYLVFETEHFSMYAVVGEADTLTVVSLPFKTCYIEGDRLATKGLVLQLGDTMIEDGYYCESMLMYQVGTQQITVKYGDAQTTFEVEVLESDDVYRGDINSDGEIDMRDAFSLYNVASGGYPLYGTQQAVADMNGDGELDMRDAFKVYQIASGA